MYNADEKQYLALTAKFRKELAEIDHQIEVLTLRRSTIESVLDGAVTLEHAEASSETLAEPSIVEREILRVIGDTPGISRSNLAEIFSNYTLREVDAAIQRLSRRSEIVVEGRGRAAVWYVTE